MKQYIRIITGLLVAVLVIWSIGTVVIAAKRGPAPPPGTVEKRDVPQLPGKAEQVFNRVTGRHPDDPDPTATLLAPFADDGLTPAKDIDRTINRLPTNAVPLDQPHRSAENLSNWLMQGISEVLSFNADSYTSQLKDLNLAFSQDALMQFRNWVEGSGVLTSLQTNGLQLNGFVEEMPFLINEGTVNGRYRWLFEVPVQVSFIPKGTTNLASQSGIDTRRLIITLQLGRVDKSSLPDNIMVESWSVKDNTRTR